MHIDWSKLGNALRSIYQSFLDYQKNPNNKRLYIDLAIQLKKGKIFNCFDYDAAAVFYSTPISTINTLNYGV